jgi:hypothetical protein
MAVDPNLPIPSYPILEPTSALTFNDLVTEVSYKIGCSYYGSDGTGAPQAPIDAHDLALCQRIVNKAVRKMINDGPRPNGWRWLNVIAQVDLWPQISYDPTGSTFVSLTPNPTVNGTTYTGCTLLTLYTPQVPPYGTNAYPNGGPPQPNPLPVPPSVTRMGTPATFRNSSPLWNFDKYGSTEILPPRHRDGTCPSMKTSPAR